MDYQRIHKVQSGAISPSKLRMKLMRANGQRMKEGSNSHSSRTSPSRMEISDDFVNNSLLASRNGDFVQEDDAKLKEGNVDAGCVRMPEVLKVDSSCSVQPIRMCEDESLDYDSTSSFEFHKGERSLPHPVAKSFTRPMSSKWNDAEKWIISRQIVQTGVEKRIGLQNQVNRSWAPNLGRAARDAGSTGNRPSVKKVDICQAGVARFAQNTWQLCGGITLVDSCPESNDLSEVDDPNLPCTKTMTDEATGIPAVRSVSMRDMGTEMTPIPSQEPSTSTTPVNSTTPIRSPTSSVPSTPRKDEHAPSHAGSSNPQLGQTGKKELPEQDLKLKTRREIVALGVQLGKMNIAAWASKDEKENYTHGNEAGNGEELQRFENAKRAAAWEEAAKSKHAARFKREEIRIQAWESQQRSKLEVEMRRIEAQIEQMRAHSQAKIVKKIAMARQKSEEKRASAEARRNRQAEKTTAQAEYIRQTGRIPSSLFTCCS